MIIIYIPNYVERNDNTLHFKGNGRKAQGIPPAQRAHAVRTGGVCRRRRWYDCQDGTRGCRIRTNPIKRVAFSRNAREYRTTSAGAPRKPSLVAQVTGRQDSAYQTEQGQMSELVVNVRLWGLPVGALSWES